MTNETIDRKRIKQAVGLLESVLEGEVDGQARDDLKQARDYAAGALPILDHAEDT